MQKQFRREIQIPLLDELSSISYPVVGSSIQQAQQLLLKLEFYTEISIYVFHSQKPADLNFPPMSQLCLKHIR